ncbi:SpoIID/LytB domain-containing protein [Kitasatospora viridis]|uniref:SpoIID/LytB domain protein n=1 Tax=Kitasatospora viridis TaxID=281105 RepID=A0A561TV82_9ACTN|nr:SpoIID/LytB domain-containing protein [Kitasatospora viridis]TWF91026.1 SpoIID/LytB domain protein [Kitasatospora viridis]
MTLIGVTAMAAVCGAAVCPAVASPEPEPAQQSSQPASIAMSGTVSDARAEKVSGGVITLPTSLSAVARARIEVDGTLVGRTDGAGRFAFDYPDAGGKAVTVTVSAPGFGRYQVAGVTPARTGDALTVLLTGKAQSMTEQGVAQQAPPDRAAAVTSATASGSCGGYSSNTTPPSTITVMEYGAHDRTGAPVTGTEIGVVPVPFESYVQHVLPSEWIPSWAPDSLKAGAMAAKTYAWYWVNNSRGGIYNGTCYNVNDSTEYQVYNPTVSDPATDAAVAATWNTVMTQNGSIFEASYLNDLTDSTSEACGAGASSSRQTLSQWGSQACAAAGYSWQSILSTYYPGVSFSGASNLGTVSMDAAGDHVAFVDTSGNVTNDYVLNGAWQAPSGIGGQARSDSPVVFDAKADHAFFVDGNGNVVNDWVSNGAWQAASKIGGQARAGSPVVTNAAGTMVAFVDSSGNVVNDWSDSTGWHGPAPVGGQARSDSGLALDANGDHLFFVDTSGNVANDYVLNGAWQEATVAGQARAGSAIATDAAGDHVVFVDGSGSIANDWVSNGTWQGPSAIGGQARSDTALALNATGDHLYFVDANGQVANDYVLNGAWQEATIGGQARAGSGIATDAAGDHVVFVDGSGKINNDWVADGAWQGPTTIGGTSR